MSTIRLTMAQALVRYLCNQFTEIDGRREPLFPGVFAIFGHGNVTCLSEALEAVKDTLPTWRGQNEQSMALAAIGFAKATRRRQSGCLSLWRYQWIVMPIIESENVTNTLIEYMMISTDTRLAPP